MLYEATVWEEEAHREQVSTLRPRAFGKLKQPGNRPSLCHGHRVPDDRRPDCDLAWDVLDSIPAVGVFQYTYALAVNTLDQIRSTFEILTDKSKQY